MAQDLPLRWLPVDAACSMDMESVRKEPNGVTTCWIRLGRGGTTPNTRKPYAYTMNLFTFRVPARQYSLTKASYFSSAGDLVDSNAPDRDWDDIVPNTVAEAVMKSIPKADRFARLTREGALDWATGNHIPVTRFPSREFAKLNPMRINSQFTLIGGLTRLWDADSILMVASGKLEGKDVVIVCRAYLNDTYEIPLSFAYDEHGDIEDMATDVVPISAISSNTIVARMAELMNEALSKTKKQDGKPEPKRPEPHNPKPSVMKA
jgi:hypothetical protein